MKEKVKTLQKLTDENLENAKDLTPEQIVSFLEDFHNLHSSVNEIEKLKLISIKIPPPLLRAFRIKCQLTGIPYQTKIKNLMKEWILSPKL